MRIMGVCGSLWVSIGVWGYIGAHGLGYWAMSGIGSVYRLLGGGGLRMAIEVYACYGCLGKYGFL